MRLHSTPTYLRLYSLLQEIKGDGPSEADVPLLNDSDALQAGSGADAPQRSMMEVRANYSKAAVPQDASNTAHSMYLLDNKMNYAAGKQAQSR